MWISKSPVISPYQHVVSCCPQSQFWVKYPFKKTQRCMPATVHKCVQTVCILYITYHFIRLLKDQWTSPIWSATENVSSLFFPPTLLWSSRLEGVFPSSGLRRLKTFYPCRRRGAVTSQGSICLPPSCPSETRADYHNGLWKLHMEQCFLRNRSGLCDSTAGPFY